MISREKIVTSAKAAINHNSAKELLIYEWPPNGSFNVAHLKNWTFAQ